MLPNFLVIGPGKSGTTWLYHALKDHPEVCVSSAKETLYFDTEYKRGICWYENFFNNCDHSLKAVGEVSNTYVFCREAPRRIKSVNPRMKLISCLRNPMERTFSHYLFLKRGGLVNGSFRTVLKNRPDLIDKGLYFKHLKPYFDNFKQEQLLVLLFENLKQDQNKFVQTIYKFLYVDPSFVPSVNNSYKLNAAKPRNPWLSYIVKKGALVIRKIGHPEWITKMKYSFIPRLFYKEYGEYEKPTINQEDRLFLEKHFIEDSKRLENFLNISLVKRWYHNA